MKYSNIGRPSLGPTELGFSPIMGQVVILFCLFALGWESNGSAGSYLEALMYPKHLHVRL